MSNNAQWLPNKPEASGSGKYLRVKDLDGMPDKSVDIRILCPFIGGWEAWDEGNKPHRFATKAEVEQSGIKLRVEPNKKNPKQFWATFVWNEAAKAVQVFSFTQVTIFTQLEALATNKKWGALDQYEVTISRKGTGTDTEYTVMPSGKEPISDAGREAWAALQETAVGLDALYHGGDPFAPFGG